MEEETPAGEVQPPDGGWDLGTPVVGDDDQAPQADASLTGAAEEALDEAPTEASSDAIADPATPVLEEEEAPADVVAAQAGAVGETSVEGGEAEEAAAGADAKTVDLPGGGQWQVTCDEDACEVRNHCLSQKLANHFGRRVIIPLASAVKTRHCSGHGPELSARCWASAHYR